MSDETKKITKITPAVSEVADKVKSLMTYENGTFDLSKEAVHQILPEDVSPEQYDKVLEFLPVLTEGTLLGFGNASIEKIDGDASKELNSTIFKYEQTGCSISHSFTGKKNYKNQLNGGEEAVSYGKITSEIIISGGSDMKRIKSYLKEVAERQFK